jgi:EF-P beta-lysylation protein EpmB
MKNWISILRENITNMEEVATRLALPWDSVLKNPSFPLNIPRRLLGKMKKADIADPLVRQFVPLQEEAKIQHGYSPDPLGEECCRRGRLLSKYHGRLLLLAHRACAMNCRFCFRRHFRHEKGHQFEKELLNIRKATDCQELILSGGEPLLCTNAKLRKLLRAIEDIPHIERIRIHSRMPIGIPERLDEEFLDILSGCQKSIVFVIHGNHASEFDDDVFDALGSIQKRGIPVLSQTVLLRGVNDSASSLEQLFRAYINHGIIPYYLHALDKVHGAHHFDVPRHIGTQIHHELTKKLPGYGVPRFVEELPRKTSKTRIT